MELMHYVLPADEILLCGALMLYGFLFGAGARFFVAWRKRRTV